MESFDSLKKKEIKPRHPHRGRDFYESLAAFVVLGLLVFGFWFTFETFALNPPTANPPSGGGNAISVDGSGTVFIGGGTGKLNAGTIDPIYEILGVKYATYDPGMVGQREEISGTAKLQALNSKSEILNNIQNPNFKTQNSLGFGATEYAYVIDFDNLEQGSDLWLFRKITDFSAPERRDLSPRLRAGADATEKGGVKEWEGLSVLLTPEFAGEVWYEKNPAENQLVIYALPTINYPVTELPSYEVSYRLTSSRFDWRQWPNLLEDQSVSGFKVE